MRKTETATNHAEIGDKISQSTRVAELSSLYIHLSASSKSLHLMPFFGASSRRKISSIARREASGFRALKIVVPAGYLIPNSELISSGCTLHNVTSRSELKLTHGMGV
ncbi:hypothetical protein RRG08_046770 [Elysia crispata]|uniref:Uncharacterized protein n=1 Tax=Elysia crispata TaxID=231223 RepID=A0AAE0ZVI7_9GAST|nr:hypothetical protein RRG08_046770 [Elysia crispata]